MENPDRLSEMAKFKITTILANTWAALDEVDRAERIAYDIEHGNFGVTMEPEGKAVIFMRGGCPLAYVEAAWLYDDLQTKFPEIEFIPNVPDTPEGL